jgi:alpha-tubulin suppressor-like RCC1 family protein
MGIAIAIASKDSHTCVLTNKHEVKCWGSNSFGQLGDGSKTDRNEPTAVSGLSDYVTAVATGSTHTCILTIQKSVKCWGDNSFGQLGDGTTTPSLSPVSVRELSGVVALAAGNSHTCALTSSGHIKCWGSNTYGQLGDGTTTDRSIPVDVGGLINPASELAVGEYHNCVLMDATSAGEVHCWGWNLLGQLGDGTTTDRYNPVMVNGFTGVTAVAAGYSQTCVLTWTGGVRCWGDTPHRMHLDALSGKATKLAVGRSHACALTLTGEIYCWGVNDHGQLGNGTRVDSYEAVAVLGLSGSGISLKAGANHACAIVEGGGIQCWGGNASGQLGNGGNTDSLTPVDVIGFGG